MGSRRGWSSTFPNSLLEVLPSLVATIVGAYIVAHYINPRPETPKAAVVATAPAGEAKDASKDASEATGTVEDKADGKSADAKSADAKSADVKAKDEARSEKAARPAKVEEKKSAAELARAAIERLRGDDGRYACAGPPRSPLAVPAETAVPTRAPVCRSDAAPARAGAQARLRPPFLRLSPRRSRPPRRRRCHPQ